MAMTEHEQTLLMDLAALLKALREERQATAQVVEHLAALLAACGDLDTKTAQALAQAVQRATASLQQAQTQLGEQIGTTIRGQHERLIVHWQQVVDQTAQVQRWLPWKVVALLLGATLLVNAGVTTWWWMHQAADLQALRAQEQLARGLSYHVQTKLAPQLSKAQQEELAAVYTAAGFRPLVPGRPAK